MILKWMEEKKLEDKKVNEYINNMDVVISVIDIETDPNNTELVKKIRFHTDKGDITWKPKTEKQTMMGGLRVLNVVPYELGLLPKKIQEWGMLIGDKGHIKANISYTKMIVDKDGGKVEYRFITSEKTFIEKWKLRDDAAKIEEVKG